MLYHFIRSLKDEVWSCNMEDKNYLFSRPTLILVSIGVIALLGFAFLAIEGGRVYIERFQAQSAASDVASFICESEHNLAKQKDGFAIQDGSNSDIANIFTVNHPPKSGAYAGDFDYVEVVVSKSVSGGLTRLVYSDNIDVTGRAVILCDDGHLSVSSAVLTQD
jgi:hypothetical protein